MDFNTETMIRDEKGCIWYKPLPILLIVPFWSDIARGLQKDNNLTDRQFSDMIWYMGLCDLKGFMSTRDQARACALRWIAGKRKVSPPGTRKKKREADEAKKMLKNIPQGLLDVVEEVLSSPMVQQYLEGNEKVFHALFGLVMKRYKIEPTVVKELLTARLSEMKHKEGKESNE